MLISWWNKKRKEKWDKMLKEYVNAPKSDYGNCKQLSNGKLASLKVGRFLPGQMYGDLRVVRTIKDPDDKYRRMLILQP